MVKELGPLDKVIKEGDVLRKQVDKIVKESLKNAKDKKLKDKEIKLKANFRSCYELKPQVTALLQKAEDLTEEGEEKKQQKNFETKKKKEVDRITAWQNQLEDAMSKKDADEEEDEEEEEESEEEVDEEETQLKKVAQSKASPKSKKHVEVEEEEEETEDEEEDDEEEESEEEEDDDDDDEEEESGEEEEGQTTMEVTTSGRQFEALYDYSGEQEQGDLSFKKGEIITILETREDGWWVAENSEGKKGNVPSSYLQTSVTDVLHALGAVPSGFRVSTLAKKFNEDLFFDPSENKIRPKIVREQRVVTITSCRQIPMLSNIHTIKVASVDKDQRTWSFNTRISDYMETFQHAEMFIRTNNVSQNLGILFELCASYVRSNTKETGEFSCGWAMLPLEDQTSGLPIQNKSYELVVNGGTPYEKGVEVDPSISRRASSNALMSLISGNKQPRLMVKLTLPKRDQKELLDTLPETLVGNMSLLQMYSYYRQDSWTEKIKSIRKTEMRDVEFMKTQWQNIVMETVYPLSKSAALPPYNSGDHHNELLRLEEIEKFRQARFRRGILAFLLSADMTHAPLDMKEVSFNVIGPYCLPHNKQEVPVES
ncbi:NPHP1-like protein [Mya arenaria]|uniref:NPHP1-like protein n=1 Tax=Mya arenaria TaxID=6604 RepID=A0ABY7FKB5_MYAAR|nr:NPHP1-like protein [Mya arenaria]